MATIQGVASIRINTVYVSFVTLHCYVAHHIHILVFTSISILITFVYRGRSATTKWLT